MAYSAKLEDLTACGAKQTALHERAAVTALQIFGRKVFVRAVVEVSNFCRENCGYCGMRRDNRNRSTAPAPATMKSPNCSSTTARPPSRTSTSRPAKTRWPCARWSCRCSARCGVKRIWASASASARWITAIYEELKAAGATVYIMKFETADAATYGQAAGSGQTGRAFAPHPLARDARLESQFGFIAGISRTKRRLELLKTAGWRVELPLHGCSVSPFVPGEDTPLATAAAGDVETTLNCMAILRLMRPDWVIPAVSALNLAQAGSGYRRGLRAGANMVTINLTPPELQRDYLIYKRDRFIMDEERVLSAITARRVCPLPRKAWRIFIVTAAATKPFSRKPGSLAEYSHGQPNSSHQPNRCTSPDPVFPLGLAHLNAALRRAGHETHWLDCNVNGGSLVETLAGFRPDFVGISLRNIDDVLIRQRETFYDGLAPLRDTIRRHSHCPVILGGSGFSIFPEKLLELAQAGLSASPAKASRDWSR